MRQNLRGIIDSPRKARSFTKSELAQIDDIVRGTTEQNALRRASRFAPSGGGLSTMLGFGGAMATPAIAAPIIGLAEAAKYLGERSTKNGIAKLLQSLAPDKVVRPRQIGAQGLARALLAGRTVAGGGQ